MRLIDMHCDTIWQLTRNENANLRTNLFCVDIEKMKQVGSMAQFFACFIYIDEFSGHDKCEQYNLGYLKALEMIAKGKKEFAENADAIALAHNYEEMLCNCEQGKMSAFLTIEEGGVLNSDMSRLCRLYEEGIRLVTLTWNYENCIGYPNSKDACTMQKGLKPFGLEVIERMNELGMIIDVSHLSDGGFWDVIKCSKKPIVASHSNARALCPHPRNLSDEMTKALAEQGGAIGVNFYPYFLNKNGVATAEDIADHIMHLYRIGGEDVIAIGTDFDGFDEGELEITHLGEMNQVYDAVKKRGLTERQMEKIWSGNAMRVIKNVL